MKVGFQQGYILESFQDPNTTWILQSLTTYQKCNNMQWRPLVILTTAEKETSVKKRPEEWKRFSSFLVLRTSPKKQ